MLTSSIYAYLSNIEDTLSDLIDSLLYLVQGWLHDDVGNGQHSVTAEEWLVITFSLVAVCYQ